MKQPRAIQTSSVNAALTTQEPTTFKDLSGKCTKCKRGSLTAHTNDRGTTVHCSYCGRWYQG